MSCPAPLYAFSSRLTVPSSMCDLGATGLVTGTLEGSVLIASRWVAHPTTVRPLTRMLRPRVVASLMVLRVFGNVALLSSSGSIACRQMAGSGTTFVDGGKNRQKQARPGHRQIAWREEQRRQSTNGQPVVADPT